MKILARLAVAFVLALLLPFPGPHIDRYIPIAAVLFRRDALEADAGFFVVTGVLLAVYTGVLFALSFLFFHRRKV